MAGQAPFLSWLAALDAPISGSIRGGWDDSFAITPPARRGNWQRARETDRGTRPVAFDGAKAYLTYDPASQMMVLDQVRVDSRDLQLSASGYLKATISEGVAEDFEGHIDIADLSANPLGSLIEPFKSQDGHVDFRLPLIRSKLKWPRPIFVNWMRGLMDMQTVSSPRGQKGGNCASTPLPACGAAQGASAWPIDFKAKPRKWIDDHISAGRWWIMNFHYTACQMNCQ